MRARGFTLLELMIILTIIASITAIAIPNLLRARMAANETATVAMIKNFGTSQELYRRTDWDANGYKEYAQNIGPSGGNGSGESLYFNKKNNVITGLMDSSVINAEIPGTGVTTATTPRNGFIFFVQNNATYPVIYSYIDTKGLMTKGYAVCAIPHQYGLSGTSTFQMDMSGVVYQKDQGNNTLVAAYNVNPSNAWFITQ